VSLKNRLARLESARPARAADLVDGLYVIADGDAPAPAPGAVLVAEDGPVSTWRLPDGRIERVRQI